MGCHTWFYNNINNIPDNHKKHIKEKLINDISKFWIMNVSKEEFIKEIQECIKEHPEDLFYKQMLKDGYYENEIIKYNECLNNLRNNELDDNCFKSILKDYYFNININDELFYHLSEFGWHDNFRVYGYPEEIFYDAKTLIEFLKNYNQDKIGITKPYGFNSDIEKLIYKFFEEFPNGIIEFG